MEGVDGAGFGFWGDCGDDDKELDEPSPFDGELLDEEGPVCFSRNLLERIRKKRKRKNRTVLLFPSLILFEHVIGPHALGN